MAIFHFIMTRIVNYFCLPRSGCWSDVLGILSDRRIWNTENARRRVMQRETFSPESTGRQNMSSDTRDRTMHGITRVFM